MKTKIWFLKMLSFTLIVWGIFYSQFSSAIIVQWKDVDTNCTLNDVSFTWLDWKKYSWAGCNSTLWWEARQYWSGWLDYWNWIFPCQNTTKVANPSLFYSPLTKEIDMGGSCKMNNIMWKTYTWIYLKNNCKASADNNFQGSSNTNCACRNWYHVPTQAEWQASMNYYYTYANTMTDQWIWWWWSATASGMAMQLKLPLNWLWDSANFGLRGNFWTYRSSTFNTNPYYFEIMWQWFNTWLWTDYASRTRFLNDRREWGDMGVRCIKDTWTEPIFFTDQAYTVSWTQYVGTGSFSMQDIFDEKWTATIWVDLVMQSNDAKTQVSIPAWTQILKSGSLANYTWTLNTPILLSTWISSWISGVLVLARLGNVWESIALKDGSGNDVSATVKIPVAGGSIWAAVGIKYSNDDITWTDLATTSIINIWWEPYVQFNTTHFTDFIITSIQWTAWCINMSGNNTCLVLEVMPWTLRRWAPFSWLDLGNINASNDTWYLSGMFAWSDLYDNYFRVEDMIGSNSWWYGTIQSSNLSWLSVTWTYIPATSVFIKSTTWLTLFYGTQNNTYNGVSWTNIPLNTVQTYLQRDIGPNTGAINLYGHQPWIQVDIPPFQTPGAYRWKIVFTVFPR